MSSEASVYAPVLLSLMGSGVHSTRNRVRLGSQGLHNDKRSDFDLTQLLYDQVKRVIVTLSYKQEWKAPKEVYGKPISVLNELIMAESLDVIEKLTLTDILASKSVRACVRVCV